MLEFVVGIEPFLYKGLFQEDFYCIFPRQNENNLSNAKFASGFGGELKWIEPFESYFSVLGLGAATYLGFGKDVRRAEADYGRLNLRNISSLAGYIIGSVVTRKSGPSL